MKKILGIMGSPRTGGNTHVLMTRMMEGAESNGASTKIIMLGDMTIKECDGCHVCWKGKECCKRDDMNDVYPIIAESDILVFGTPVYWYGPTGLMKIFLDRFVYFNCPENRPMIAGKKSVLVVPFEEDTKETAGPLVALFEKSFDYLEVNLAETILVPGVYEKGDVLKKSEVLDEAFQIGKNLMS
jgi:multimeric flavodoxin WrbA